MNFRILYYLLMIVVLFTGCSKDETLQGSLVNFYGGTERNNNYEEWGDFYQQYFISEIITAKDTSGSISPVLALSSWQYIFATTDGSIVYYNHKKFEWEQKLDRHFVCAAGMVADKEQNIYVIDNNGSLYSFSITGKLRWKLQHTSFDEKVIITFPDLLAVDDGIVASSTDGIIAKYSFAGKVIWKKNFSLPTTDYFASDDSGNLYIPLTHNRFGANDTIISLNKSGKINWVKPFDNTRIIKPPVIFKDKLYICCVLSSGESKSSVVQVLNKDNGKKIHTHKYNQTPRFISVDDDGNYYIVAYDAGFGKDISNISCRNEEGKIVWDKYLEVTIPYPVMISSKSLAFIGVDKDASGVYFLTKKGLIRYVVSLTEAPTISYQPTVAPGNKIVFGATERLGLVFIENSPMKKYIPW